MTLDEMAKDKRQWPTIWEMVASEQIPASRLAELRRTFPDLATWLDKRRGSR